MDVNDAYAPPKSNLETLGENQSGGEYELASRWLRLGAAIIDGIIIMLFNIPLMFVTGFWDKTVNQTITISETVFLGVVGMIIYLILNGYLLAKRGQTIGKRLLGTRIVDKDSNEILPLWKVIVLRMLPINILSHIPVIGPFFGIVDALFIFTKEKRCLHDYIAGTKVLKVK